MAIITIGPDATNRASVTVSGNVVLDLANPSNGTGTITSVSIYVASTTTTTAVGIFYLVSGTTYKCRSAVSLGSLSAGLNTINDLNLDVVTGDVIGCYHSGGAIDRADNGGSSAYYSGNTCIVGNQTSYVTSGQARIISVQGSGSSSSTHEGVTNPQITSELVIFGIAGVLHEAEVAFSSLSYLRTKKA